MAYKNNAEIISVMILIVITTHKGTWNKRLLISEANTAVTASTLTREVYLPSTWN